MPGPVTGQLCKNRTQLYLDPYPHTMKRVSVVGAALASLSGGVEWTGCRRWLPHHGEAAILLVSFHLNIFCAEVDLKMDRYLFAYPSDGFMMADAPGE